MENMEARDLVREEDLEVWLSCAFIIYGSMKSFVEMRDAIEGILEDRQGQNLIFNKASGEKLYVVKEREYELIKEIKGKY